ncbi:hypothetical protein Goe27_01590 [Bacillus phage vB_BsuM-Goe27]|uniref:Uncharacterized protein n=1 Tax=Bacillus phage vB_BsuM-Goe3 TaxID=1933063 RepID=A0A217ER96_BPGO3|nr:hypothetical protein HWB07_gp151 [Bacillus phage vB_BsuM-Goe3]AYJ76357.1 hypothetical protein BSP12_171 [Bacillus phage BSP12]QDP43185.1 hypothetical protein Goe7_c01600 [Bacillus phage vB_BveM-Goe7]WCS69535.1 hypothetical protein Goe24_01600 [Bacillus phage vB_BsuM-Goe24]WCS70037.1 hypothetical protein Goe27_01590 [Bacillus phage vB_BsuM-Goe27]APZ82619.1 hypothetical protein Goe3_c15800 [Bacillus phage vB_BsuM-Goe3]
MSKNQDKFIVWNKEELIQSCTEAELMKLNAIVGRIVRKRIEEGKKPQNGYIVVNTDEPYAEEVRDILRKNGAWEN